LGPVATDLGRLLIFVLIYGIPYVYFMVSRNTPCSQILDSLLCYAIVLSWYDVVFALPGSLYE
jgi:hypothetical protein